MTTEQDDKSAYSKGYQAGRKRMDKDIAIEQLRAQDREFFRQLVVASLPVAFSAQGWTNDKEPITSAKQRAELAVHFAQFAYNASKRGPK